ncbi:MAG: MFS transporter [Candidatus Sigynarchaeota archaeon]
MEEIPTPTRSLISHKVPFKQKALLGVTNAGANFVNGMLYGALLKYYTDYVLMEPALFGIVYIFFGIWNAIDDPLFGYYSDRKPPVPGVGKRLPWMRRAIPFMVLGYMMIWYPAPDWGQALISIYLLAALFCFDTGFAIFMLNQCALATGFTDDPDERASTSMVNSYINMIPGAIYSFIPPFILTSSFSRDLVVIIFTIVGIGGAVMMIISAWKIKEPSHLFDEKEALSLKKALVETFKSRSFVFFVLYSFAMSGVALAFNQMVPFIMEDMYGARGFAAILPGIAGGVFLLALFPVIRIVNRKIGVRQTLMIFAVITLAGFLGLTLVENYWIMFIFYTCVMLGSNAHWMLANTIVGDIADEDQLKTGHRREGMFFGINALISTPASSVIIFIFSQILSIFGYNGEADHQTVQAVFGIRLGVGFVPFCFIVLAIAMLYFYPLHGERYLALKRDIATLFSKKAANS